MLPLRYAFYIAGGICFLAMFYLSYSIMYQLNEKIDGLHFLSQRISEQKQIYEQLSEALNPTMDSKADAPSAAQRVIPAVNYENAPASLFDNPSFRSVVVQQRDFIKALTRLDKDGEPRNTSAALNASSSMLNELTHARDAHTVDIKSAVSTFVWLCSLTLVMGAFLIGLPFAAQHKHALQAARETNARLKMKARELSATHNTMGNMLEDIIYQRRQATRTEENNARLASIINSAEDAIFSLNMTGVVVTANPAAERLFGNNLVGRQFYQLFKSGVAEQIRTMLLATQEQNSGSNFDVNITSGNHRTDLSLTISPIHAEQNNLVGFSVIAKNFSGTIQEQERFRLAVEASPNAMIMINRHGHIVLANSEVENLFGYTQEELYGQPIHILVPSHQRKNHMEHLTKYLKNPQKRSMFAPNSEICGERKDESKFPVEVSLTPIEMENETYIICSIVNISERLNQQSKLQKLNSELSRKNDELEQFIYAVSHDLKAPLVTISGFAQRLINEKSIQSEPKHLHKLNRILSNSKSMDTLLNDLLNLSRVIKRDLEKTQVDPQNIIRQVLSSLESQIKNSAVDIRVMPPFNKVYAHESLLSQCLQNILANALKYRNTNVPPIVKIMPFSDPNYTGITVSDNGIGIPEEHQQKIFTVFERLHPQLCEGAGVGLAIVKTIMEKHDGKVTLESTEGVGSQFTLMFPRQNAPQSDQ